MARIESAQQLVGKTVTRLNGERDKIAGLLLGGYKMTNGRKLSARNLVRQGGKFVEIPKTDIRQLQDMGGYVKVEAEVKPANTSHVQPKPENKFNVRSPSARRELGAKIVAMLNEYVQFDNRGEITATTSREGHDLVLNVHIKF